MEAVIKEYLDHPKVDFESIEIHWLHDYYDGYLSGFCTYNGQFCFFDCCDDALCYEEKHDWYRRFTVHPLTAEQEAKARSRHALFQEHVGTHMDWPRMSASSVVHPQEKWGGYYDVYRDDDDYHLKLRDIKAVAWFED